MNIYRLTSENLTGLGGPMGTERTWANWHRYFSSISSAQSAAVQDHGKEIDWFKDRRGGLRSADLGHVMYLIAPIEVEP